MKEPYKKLLEIIHIHIAKSTITNFKPVIFDVLKLFTKNENLCNIFMEYCKPVNPDNGIHYANTILGALLSISILPKLNNGSYEFFQNPLDPVMIYNILLILNNHTICF